MQDIFVRLVRWVPSSAFGCCLAAGVRAAFGERSPVFCEDDDTAMPSCQKSKLREIPKEGKHAMLSPRGRSRRVKSGSVFFSSEIAAVTRLLFRVLGRISDPSRTGKTQETSRARPCFIFRFQGPDGQNWL